MKIVIIGPVYPFKSGIAHYTGLMYKNLKKNNDVEMISFSMQYPKILFKDNQYDYSNNLFEVEGAQFLINTANPINIISVGKKINKLCPDMVILQWWHPYFSPCYNILISTIKKSIKKIFICHNVYPHEKFPGDKLLSRQLLKRGNGYIVHSESEAKNLLEAVPDADYRINPHPSYDAFNVNNISKDEARRILSIDQEKKLLLFFGFVKEYKGLKHLIKAMPELKNHYGKDIKLMIVGDFGNEKDEYMGLMRELDIENNVMVVDEFVPDDEVENYFAACDLVVLPYESATQSGIVPMAYGFEKPVLVTAVGGLPDVVMNGKTGYVVEPRNPAEISAAIKDFYDNHRESIMIENVRTEAEKYSWDKIAEKIMSFCK